MKQDKPNINKLLSGYKVPGTKSNHEAYLQSLSEIEAKQKPKTRYMNTRKIIYWAGSVSAAAIIVIAFLLNGLQTNHEYLNNELTAQATQLPDNSTVSLKTNSSLQYNESILNGTRAVEMIGEAFFEVTKGKTFKVHFPGGKLQVLGTKFNIRSYNNKYGRVDCYEGSVRLEVHDKSMVLTKGQAIRYSPTTVEGPFDFDVQEAMKIPDGNYQWINRPLEEVLTFISSRAGYELIASPKVLDLRFTGTLNLTNNKIALTILSKAMHFKYEIKGKKLIILEETN